MGGIVMTDLEYWEMASQDREVDTKYIADVSTEDCLTALAPALDGKRILELGSGVGRLTIPVAARRQEAVITGIDLSPGMIELAITRANESGVGERCYFIQPKIMESLADETYDSAYTMLTIQHLDKESVAYYFREIYRLLKPGAIFRFQFVEGKYYGTRDNNYSLLQMIKLNKEYFYWDRVERGLIHPQWTWITAIRRKT